jgi:ASC-1-like (ASCH) protein
MKKWVLRFRVKDRKNFLEIKNGLKVVETRAATERYRPIQKGDVLVFVCGKEKNQKMVKRVRIFKTIGAMIKTINFKKIMPSVSSTEELRDAYYSYPGYKEKISKFGIIALDI